MHPDTASDRPNPLTAHAAHRTQAVPSPTRTPAATTPRPTPASLPRPVKVTGKGRRGPSRTSAPLASPVPEPGYTPKRSHPLNQLRPDLVPGPTGRAETVITAIVRDAVAALERARVRGELPIVTEVPERVSHEVSRVLYDIALGVPKVLGSLHETLEGDHLTDRDRQVWTKWVTDTLRTHGVTTAQNQGTRGVVVSDVSVFEQLLLDTFLAVSKDHMREPIRVVKPGTGAVSRDPHSPHR